MAKIDFPKKQEQRLIPKYLLEYSQMLQENHPDPTAEWGHSGTEYTAGNGIDITNDTISIDSTVVATKNDIPDVSGFITGDDLSEVLEDYELKSEAFSGSYNDLTDKPTFATVATSGDYDDLINKPDLSIYETKAEAFSGSYNDLTNKPDLSIYQLASTAFSGNYNDLTNKPDLSVYQLAANAFSGNYNDLTNKPDLSIYAQSANLATVATTGAYSDLTGTPTIPDTSNMVTTDTTQNITGIKTFVGEKKLKFKQSTSSNKLGFTLYNNSNVEKCYFEYNPSNDGLYLGRYGSTAVTEMGFLSESTPNKGYKVLMPNLTVTGSAANNVNYMAVSVNNVKADSSGNVTLSIPDVSNYYTKTEVDGLIPTATSELDNDSGFITGITSADVTTALGYTPGTSNFSGDYTDLTNKPTIPDAVSGTNDGTNWTSLTIGNNTYSIPSGGGSSATANLFLHNFRLAFTTTTGVTSYIESTILTKSATQILTITELVTQVAALQATAYDDSVIGVIYGQWYRSNAASTKETILGFGLTGSASSPNLYMTVPNGSGPTRVINFVSTMAATLSISWVNGLMTASGLEVAAECTDVVTPAII